MIYLQGIPGRTAEVDNQAFLFFSGFAYLGMPSLQEFQKIFQEGVRKSGAVFPSSRISNTRHSIYEKFEEELSVFTGWPASVSFSSGYLAAVAAVQYASRQGRIFNLKKIHPSLQINRKNISVESTREIIEGVNTSDENCTIVLESVDPLTGRLADFDWLKQIHKSVRVIVDDSHGVGLLGEKGAGVKAFLPKTEFLHYLICYSLSKAFSCEGGAVSGRREDIDQIKNKPPFTAATPMAPAFVYAWMNSRPLFEEQLRRLKENTRYFAKKTADMKKIDFDERLPVCFLSDETLYGRALKYRILLSAFRYPTERDNLMTRIVLNALHTEEDIDHLLHCIRQAGS